MKKLLTLILAVMLLCSFTLPAFADSTIDLTQTGSVNLWKYDLSSAQADGVWDSSYVSTGVRDQSGVEAILGASGSSSGYAIEGVVYTYLKVAELKSVTVTDNDVERSELMYGIVNNAANTAFLTAIGVSANDRYAAADEQIDGVTFYYFRSDVLINGLSNKTVTDSFGTLVVKHVTESGTVLNTQNAKYRAGSTYRALPDSTILFSRTLKGTTGATSGTVTANSSNTVTFTYSDSAIKDGYLTVNYHDNTGSPVKEMTKLHLKEGDSYNVSAPAVAGYELDTSKYPSGTVGTFDGNDKTITFTYKTAGSSITVHYFNSANANNVWMYAYNDDGEIFGKWDAVLKNANAKMTAAGDGWMNGTIPASSARVIFRISGGKQEPGQGESGYLVSGEVWIKNKEVTFSSTIKTSHININTGEKISPDVVVNAEKVTSSGTYTTSPLEGRTDVITPGNATGNYTPGVTNVVYFYTGGDTPIPTDPTDPSTEPTTEPTEPSTDNPEGVLIGDVDLDGTISIKDATLIQKHLAELEKLTGDALTAADCNGDGKVTIKDVTALQKYKAEYTSEIGNVGRRI